MPPITRKKLETPTKSIKKSDTLKYSKTKERIRELVAEYNKLEITYKTAPTAENKRRMVEYAYHLKNPTRLSILFQNDKVYGTDGFLLGDGRIREAIQQDLNDGNLIKVDGLIRLPNTIPYENVSSTGNTVHILLNPRYIDELITILKTTLIDDSVQITVPCNNMIIIIELGDYTPNINNELLIKIKQIIMEFALTHRLLSKETCEKTKYYLN